MWYAYLVGFGYAIIIGHLLINPIVWLKRQIVQPSRRLREHEWQAITTGLIERALFVTALLMGYASFIGFWVALKIAVRWREWEDHREYFMNVVNANGLSILFAAVGYKMIDWIKLKQWFYAATVPILLILGSALLFYYLEKIYKKSSK